MLDVRDLTILSRINGFTLWHVATSDPLRPDLTRPVAAVLAEGWFDAAAGKLRRGDFVMVNAGTGGPSVIEGAVLLVTAVGNRRVSVAPMASVTAPLGGEE